MAVNSTNGVYIEKQVVRVNTDEAAPTEQQRQYGGCWTGGADGGGG